ncbi:NF038130 family PEP-CTERM protein [Nodularia sp. NIES-3585]|uniref:NF038130 family PEP-CTERM protein n=1 Tax=Nodularia sp. NIES-3585 TaxID=1973477 RepID=UPI000B5C5E78|nr:NF038130 family PEP-CTERM protein [Nodularia sp. NIES-3585]GAX36967.1 hypothetical protein NIES3585_30060 [Nodularia sp. NIES-3585]
MKRTFQTLMIGAAMAVGVSAIAASPAQAGSLTNATIGGTKPSDYYVYDSNGKNTFQVPNTPANVQKVLDGNASNPTGNIELAASSETLAFDFSKNTTLTGQIGGKDITLSSLTFTDWFSTGSGAITSYGANNFANTWFNKFYDAGGLAGRESAIKIQLGIPNIIPTPSSFFREQAFNAFFNIGGFQRTSDPNISYVNQDNISGEIKIGLAGHYDLKAYYLSLLTPFGQFLNDGFQASEVVKYSYEGNTGFLYSFQATKSGLTSLHLLNDHSGNYEVTIAGVPPTSVPEPSVVLGILSVAGMFVTQRKNQKSN